MRSEAEYQSSRKPHVIEALKITGEEFARKLIMISRKKNNPWAYRNDKDYHALRHVRIPLTTRI